MSTSTTLTIHLEDQAHSLPTGSSLAHFLALLQCAPESVATALNGQFVARDARAATLLSDGDQVLLFKPIVGG
ncbi:MAG: thiamine biosynthesis protein ThiS [Methylibium sp.]|nr:thiamine biosynthesis protein ThiS [Methylibium sp.]